MSRADRAVVFLETLPVTSGKLTGTKFRVRDWQRKWIIDPLYATDANGRRLAREAVITMGRKNGKTGLTAGITLLHFVGPESVTRGELYSAAAKRKQAAKLFEEMKAIIRRTPWMSSRIIIRDFNKQLEDVVTGSIYYALAAEASTEHGGNTSFWVFDELAQAKNRLLYEVLKSSTGAQQEPLGIVISTQSHDPNHIMSEQVDYGMKILDGREENPAFVAAIFTTPKDADPWDEKNWYAANPALGDFRDLEEMREFAKQARSRPALEATFRLLYLNQRVSAGKKLIPAADWIACSAELRIEDFRGRHCVGAIDLSGSGHEDLTALVLLFDDIDDSGNKTLTCFPFFWAMAERLEQSEARDRVPYRLWADQGHLITTPGRVFKYEWVAQKIGELKRDYDIEVVGVDPWAFDKMVAAIDEEGFELTIQNHGQNIQQMAPAVTAMESMVFGEHFRHNGNPVLAWCIDNIEVMMDSNGNRKLDKRTAKGRIDGAQALTMAAHIATAVQAQEASYACSVI